MKVHMHENALACDMQHKKHHGLSPIQTKQHTTNQQI